MSYVLRASNPSKLVGGNVYYCDHGQWSNNKEKAVKFKTKKESDVVKEEEMNSSPLMGKIVSENLNLKKKKGA